MHAYETRWFDHQTQLQAHLFGSFETCCGMTLSSGVVISVWSMCVPLEGSLGMKEKLWGSVASERDDKVKDDGSRRTHMKTEVVCKAQDGGRVVFGRGIRQRIELRAWRSICVYLLMSDDTWIGALHWRVVDWKGYFDAMLANYLTQWNLCGMQIFTGLVVGSVDTSTPT